MFLSHYGYRRNQTHRKLLLHNNVDMTTDETGDIIERKVETEQNETSFSCDRDTEFLTGHT